MSRFKFPAYVCPPIPTWEGYIVTTNETRANTSVFYECQDKLHFEGQREQPNVTLHAKCSAIGEWSPPLRLCIGKWNSRCIL